MASPLAINMMGLSVAGATATVSMLALFSVIGRIFAGSISDRIGRINTLALACILSVVGMILLYTSTTGNLISFYAGIAIIGICFGSFMGVFPGFTADQFGPKNNSVNFGIMFIGFATAGYFGPTILNNIYGASGSYKNAFLVAMCFSLLGLALTFVYRNLSKKYAN